MFAVLNVKLAGKAENVSIVPVVSLMIGLVATNSV